MSARLVSFPISAAFVAAHAWPTALELGAGFEERWLAGAAVLEVALGKYTAGIALGAPEEALALLPSDEFDRIPDLVDELRSVRSADDDPDHYWLYVALAWLLEHRSDFDDPLGVIEMLFTDFGHPDEIAKLVRWMPATEGEPVGLSAIESRWRDYVDRVRAEFRARPQLTVRRPSET